MGMFDWVEFEAPCPKCGERVTGFQTKDRDNVLDCIPPVGLESFYTSCDRCDMWIEYRWNEGRAEAELNVPAMLASLDGDVRLLRKQLFALCDRLEIRASGLLLKNRDSA